MDLSQKVKSTHIFESGDNELPRTGHIGIYFAAFSPGAAAGAIEQAFGATGDRAYGSENPELTVTAATAVLHPEARLFCLSEERCVEGRDNKDLREDLCNGLHSCATREREDNVVPMDH